MMRTLRLVNFQSLLNVLFSEIYTVHSIAKITKAFNLNQNSN